MIFSLEFFAKSDKGICANDFKNPPPYCKINLNFVLSLLELIDFTKPLSGDFVKKYAIVTMSNNDKYYILEPQYHTLSDKFFTFSL